jgi:hypothetical protein
MIRYLGSQVLSPGNLAVQVIPVAALVEIVLLHFCVEGCSGSAKCKKSHEECLGKHDDGEFKIEAGCKAESFGYYDQDVDCDVE